MMDLKCEYASVDVVSTLGTNQNVSEHITKWHVDAAGVRQRYQGRNKNQHDIEMFDPNIKDSIEDLYANGEDAISLDAETLEYALKEQEYLFVDFFASWCSHCRDLAPTWETLAEVMNDVATNLVHAEGRDYDEQDIEHAKRVQLPVMIAKVDCVMHPRVCQQQRIMAYPTLRLFVDGKRWRAGDYRGHRTVVDMADWLQQIEDTHKTELEKEDSPMNVRLAHEAAQKRMQVEDLSEEENEFADKVKRHRQRLHHAWVDEEHPGCQLSGHLLLDRAPGNFHIQARSPHHDMVPNMANVSHVVHQLSIGDPVAQKLVENGSIKVPPEVVKKLAPMDGNVYVTEDLHEAYHHYLKVVTTNVDGLRLGRRDLRAYQIIQSSQLAYYRSDVVPEAKFIFDLSPISVSYRTHHRAWYDFFTSLLAIIGGTFTIVGVIESSISAIASRKKRF